ncbi:hypothetical protein NBRC3257_0771 [Gluconobacter thailandicus NBRC 3257]|uniref:Uncharacterized protein n=1 Tax=Gluconobacter thailandicus NBRC 3257 TaxID=1381097 RepID=A0ABQ0IU94_GLUTH|nr:hypothetical protein NBRC3255_1722 [Gluconobacter thailandicus NBRC 3255]GAD25772.1 hypothetical protein NBRC3257_0771 [Gluconobacter thailandicus NBRC 3257]
MAEKRETIPQRDGLHIVHASPASLWNNRVYQAPGGYV